MSDELSIDGKLQQCLGPELVSNRIGFGGSKLMYIEGKTAINLANEIFGYNGWSSEVKDTQMDFYDVSDDGRISLGISTTVRITLKDGTYHEDVGYGVSENSKTKAAAFEKARKESSTDGLKRALRMFGNALGNCIYDKTYLRNIGNMSRPSIPFNPLDLYRHPHVRKTIDEQLKRTIEKQTTSIASSASSPTHPAPTPVAAITSKVNTSPSKQQQQQQLVINKSTTLQHTTPAIIAPSRSAYKNDILKRELDDDFGPEIFAEDSFIIDDDDDEFYAQVADYDSMPHSPPPSHERKQTSAGSGKGVKRQCQ